MAKYTVKELAQLLNTLPQHINTYKNRGKIILLNGIFDTTNPINKYWLSQKQNKTTVNKVNTNKTNTETKQINVEETKVKSYVDTNNNNKDAEKYFNELDKLKLDKLKAEVEVARMKMAKIQGEVIPVDFVERIFGLHFNNITAEFYNAADNYTAIIVEKLNGTREDLVHFRKHLKEIINNSVEESKKISKRDIDIAIKKHTKDEDLD
jgi:hypothetical protein